MKTNVKETFDKYLKHIKVTSLLSRGQIFNEHGFVVWEQPEDEYQAGLSKVDNKLVELWNRKKQAEQDYNDYVENMTLE